MNETETRAEHLAHPLTTAGQGVIKANRIRLG